MKKKKVIKQLKRIIESRSLINKAPDGVRFEGHWVEALIDLGEDKIVYLYIPEECFELLDDFIED